MANRYIMTDGKKAVSLTGDEGWVKMFNNGNTGTYEEQYARVAAVFRAYNIKANIIANMPFVLFKGSEEFDTSLSWENKVKIMPNPQELLRLDVLSLIATNTAYNLRTTDALGYKTKSIYHAIAYSFTPNTNPVTGELTSITRKNGTILTTYAPDDPRLIKLWRLDHTTEVLPSENTEAKAIMTAAGQVLNADQWISHFYEGGGIPPTLIAMKGLVDATDKETREKSWSSWLKQVGKYVGRQARIYNAETMDVKQMGSSVTDLKNMEVYKQALENIAMGTGMPLSLLLANSASYATASQEYESWIKSEIVPYCNWIAYEYNTQLWSDMGLRMKFQPEKMVDEESLPATDISTFMDFLQKCPTYELFIGTCETFGYELSDSLVTAAQKYYSNKDVIEVQPTQPTPPPMNTDVEDPEDVQPAKWIPTLEQSKELLTLRKVALKKWRDKQPLVFDDFIFYNGGLPDDVFANLKLRLSEDREWTEEEIKAVFVANEEPQDNILLLAQAINRLADKA